jgi:hypothetical protein
MAVITDKDSKEFRTLVEKCIEAYRDLMNVGLALDLCRVQGKMRTFIIRDPEFIVETRAIRAQSYKEELEEVEQIYTAAAKLGESDNYDDYEGDDGRSQGKGKKKSQVGNDKDALTMQLKAATMRRELKSLSAEDNTDSEESTLNFFFTALTKEEMEALKEVEVNHGTGDDSALMAMGGEDAEEDVAAQAKKRNEKNAKLTGSSADMAAAIDEMTPEQREELLMALVAKEGQ